MNAVLYEFKPKNCAVIGTINIVTHIIDLTNILLEEKRFPTELEAFTYIYFASDKIIKNGEHFIDKWSEIAPALAQA